MQIPGWHHRFIDLFTVRLRFGFDAVAVVRTLIIGYDADKGAEP